MLMIAAAAAIASSVLGTLASFHINAATGPCIVLIQAAFFVLALLWNLLVRRRRVREPRGPSPLRAVSGGEDGAVGGG
jgi:manganese/iron transport system permease protein